MQTYGAGSIGWRRDHASETRSELIAEAFMNSGIV
jgi:hypothetical protein